MSSGTQHFSCRVGVTGAAILKMADLQNGGCSPFPQGWAGPMVEVGVVWQKSGCGLAKVGVA